MTRNFAEHSLAAHLPLCNAFLGSKKYMQYIYIYLSVYIAAQEQKPIMWELPNTRTPTRIPPIYGNSHVGIWAFRDISTAAHVSTTGHFVLDRLGAEHLTTEVSKVPKFGTSKGFWLRNRNYGSG